MRAAGYLSLLLIAVPGSPARSATLPEPTLVSHGEAVEIARRGDIERALGMLRVLRDAAPEDEKLLHDETVVLAWGGRDALVLANAASIDIDTAPSYVMSAVARSARNSREFDMAARWYAALLDRDSRNLDARLGLAMTHADAGDRDRAWSTIADIPDHLGDTVPAWMAEAHLLEREGRFMEALARYQRVLEAEADNRDALRGQAIVLRTALLPKQALALAEAHPGILTAEEIIQLEADVVALHIRHGAQSSYPMARRHEGTDRALAKIDALLARSGLERHVRVRLRYDRVVALSDRLLMADAIAEFEAIPVALEDVPAYALAAVGRAYLYEHRPENARDALELAVRKEPGNIDYRFQLFFAYADLQQAERALDLAESLLADLAPTNRTPGSPVVKGNEDYLRAAIMAGLARAFADRLGDSQDYFEALLAQMPHNTDVRQELANVYRWRGWLDRSLSEYAQVLAVEPELMSARIGHAHTQLDSRDYARVEEEVRALGEHYGDERAVRNLTERWRVHNRQELRVDAEVGQSSGPTFGEDQYRVDAVWYSRPLARRFRVAVNTHDAFAEFPEGDARRRRLGAGLEYRHRRWLANASLSADRSGGDLGFRGSFDYRLSDLFSVGAALETDSNSTPLRGARVGIENDIIAFNAEYARHESTAVRATLSYQDLSDGNSGRSLFVGAEQRLVARSGHMLTLTGDVAFEDRDREDVAYFSPRSGFTWTIGLRSDWTMYRRYDFSLTHSVEGTIGGYDQSAFDADDIWSLGYRFSADISKRWGAHVGVSRRSNVYDGGREYATFVIGGFSARF